jgi:hypothetical protein
LVAVAVNVKEVPAHTVVLVVLMLTVGVLGTEFTVRVMAFEVAVALLKQLALLVSTQVMISPLTNVVLL